MRSTLPESAVRELSATKHDMSDPQRLSFISSLVLLIVLLNVLKSIYNILFHPLRKFPGPIASRMSRFPMIRAQLTGKVYQYLSDCHAKHGPIVRVAPDELTTIEPQAWADLYQQRPQTQKDPFGQLPPLNGADSLFTADDVTHKRMRGTLVYAFSDKALRDQSPIIESYVDAFIARIDRENLKARRKGAPGIDLSKFLGYMALDIVSDLSLGECFNGLNGDNEHDWIRGFWLGATFGSVRTSLSRFYPLDMIFGSIFLRLTAKQRHKNWALVTDSLTRRLQRGNLGDLRSDFVTPVIGNVREGKTKGITRKELNTNSLALVIAGCEVAHVALAGTCYYLLRHERAWNRLKEEIREHFQRPEDITIASTMGLPYLLAVIDEGLRVYHPTPSHLPRVTPPAGQMVGSHFVPGGFAIGIGLQTIQTYSGHWVEPLVFNPERWLASQHKYHEARFDDDKKEAFRPFSSGPRNCLGGKVYLAEARMALAKLAWHYEARLVDPIDVAWHEQPAYLVYEPRCLIVALDKA